MKKIFFIFLFMVSALVARAQQPFGIDVSHHQGAIDWSLVYADGKVFAFVKATEGVTYNDPQFVTNMNGGTNAGLLMGAYHFARPDNNSAVDEANHFVQVAGPYIGNGYLPPVLDLEDPPGDDLQTMYTSQELTQWVRTWLQTVEDSTGVRPIIYTNGRYTQYLSSSLNSYKLWIAEPDGSPTSPPDNLGHWTDWAFKQYSWHGNVSGISGEVDLNVFNGTMAELDSLAAGGNNNNNGGGDNTSVLDCDAAVSLACGDYYHGPSSTDSSRVYSYGCNGWSETGPERLHRFTPSQNTDLNVIISGFQGDLDVYILEDCDPAHCVGNVYSSSANLTGLTAGHTYYLVVDADDGSGSDYDIYLNCYAGNLPDDISLNNARVETSGQLNAGDNFNVTVKQYYAGDASSMPSVYVGYYLSRDTLLDQNDTFLGSDPSDIHAGHRTETENHTLMIPSGTPDGNYYLLFVADYTHQITEATELNNVVAVPLQVGQVAVEKFDLASRIRIYPNPVEEELHLSVRDGVRLSRAEIYNQTGQRLFVKEQPGESLRVDNLKPGVYFLRLRDNEGNEALIRFIKKR